MKKTFLLLLVLLTMPALTQASMESGGDEVEKVLFESTDIENQLTLADTTAVNVAFQQQLELANMGTSGEIDDNSKNLPVSVFGIIFAVFLWGAGVIVGRKKKTKVSSVVGAFARSN